MMYKENGPRYDDRIAYPFAGKKILRITFGKIKYTNDNVTEQSAIMPVAKNKVEYKLSFFSFF